MTDPLDVSVVICAYTEDRWPQLLEAIASVQRQSPPPRELIVAIDHNPALLQRLGGSVSDITILDSLGPKGKSGALNTAVDAATSSVIALLDDDAAAEPGWLVTLHQNYSDSRVLGVGGYLEPVWSNGRPRWFPEEFLWIVGCTFRGMPTKRSVVRSVIGANMSFRTEVFREAGGSMPGLGPDGTELTGAARAEDTEFCLRANAIWPDRVWLYEPRARVRHHVPSSRGTWTYFRNRCYVEGLSKAVLARVAGSRRGLAMERRYALRTLPSGVLRSIARGIMRRELGAFLRAGAIVAGLSITTIAYVRETARLRRAHATIRESAVVEGADGGRTPS